MGPHLALCSAPHWRVLVQTRHCRKIGRERSQEKTTCAQGTFSCTSLYISFPRFFFFHVHVPCAGLCIAHIRPICSRSLISPMHPLIFLPSSLWLPLCSPHPIDRSFQDSSPAMTDSPPPSLQDPPLAETDGPPPSLPELPPAEPDDPLLPVFGLLRYQRDPNRLAWPPAVRAACSLRASTVLTRLIAAEVRQ